MKQTIAIANDHAGVELKAILIEELKELGYDVEDIGTGDNQSVDYPDFANALANWMQRNPGHSGVLICGSGIGISIAANRHKHIRAALCGDGLAAQMARRHNNANVLCLGARMIGPDMAKFCLKQFLTTEFEGGRHEKRVNKL
ncbi:MAG: ribose 5-phosphate isomerase B [Candidatus Nitrotoga sp.]